MPRPRFPQLLVGFAAVFLSGVLIYHLFQRSLSPEQAQRRIVKLGYRYEPGGLFAAVRDDNPRAVDLFLRAGMDPNLYDRTGFTPLVLAIKRGNPRMVRLLIEGGADPNLPDGKGILPLGHAVKQDSLELVKLLLELGADPNRRDHEGFTAIALAQRFQKSPAIIELLKRHGAGL